MPRYQSPPPKPFAPRNVDPPYRVELAGSAADLQDKLNELYEAGYNLDDILHTVAKGPGGAATQFYTVIARLAAVQRKGDTR